MIMLRQGLKCATMQDGKVATGVQRMMAVTRGLKHATAGRLEGKVAVITGAASGFGAGASRRFVEEGGRVVMGDIQDAGELVADELGESAVFMHCDVANEDDVANLVNKAVSHFGQLDIMVNNAGVVGAVGPIATTPADEWQRTLDIHVNGCFYGCKHAARVMIPREAGGSIINTSSTAGIMGGLGPHAYTAAKHAIIGITKSVACELAQYGIRANCISPAGMATPMVAAVMGDHTDLQKARDFLAPASPLKGRPGLPEDVVNAMLFLASDESGYTSGLTLTTDAGITIGSTNPQLFHEHQPFIREAGKRGL